jgi:uncharacterized protein YjbJ (UPF0337 family)
LEVSKLVTNPLVGTSWGTQELTNRTVAAKDKVKDATSKVSGGDVKGKAAELKGEAKGKAQELKGDANQAAGQAKGKAAELKGEAKKKVIEL